MKAHVRCPSCPALLEFEMPEGFELWGVIPVLDVGCMEVTMPYDKAVQEHLDAHTMDEKQKARDDYYARMRS